MIKDDVIDKIGKSPYIFYVLKSARKNIFGFALTGSIKGFDVISEVSY